MNDGSNGAVNTQPSGSVEMTRLWNDGLHSAEIGDLRGAPLAGGRRSSYRRWVVIAIGGFAVFALLAASYAVGRASAPTSGVCPPNSAGDTADTVAPEGPVISSFETKYDYRGRPRELQTSTAAVAADHGRCSDLGLEILQRGGNALDAAVTTVLCQGIYNPMASGIGGGHIMMIRLPNGTTEVVDAREVAPRAATEGMFKGRPEAALEGGLAVAVPLELRGLYMAHARHGVLPWVDLVSPVVPAAEHGFPAHPYLVSALRYSNFSRHASLRETFYINDGKTDGGWRPPEVNETCCRRPNLAALLRDVAAIGPDALYVGKYAVGFVQDIQNAGGVITLEDLAAAQPSLKPSLHANVMGVDVWAPPPPSSAASVLNALMIIGGYQLPLAGAGPLGVHREVEALKHAFALRLSLGDPGTHPQHPFLHYLDEIVTDAVSSEYATSLRNMIEDETVIDAGMYGGRWNMSMGGVSPEDHGTSHVSVVDADGMAVSLTTTINTGFGSKVLSKSTGILLNNQMDDFSTPDQANVYGLAPSPANYIRPGKKPLSSMSPLIVERDGRLRMVLGASGGPRIISALLQTLLRVLAYGEDAFAAVAGPRLHHQLLPQVLYVENWATDGGAQFRYDNDTLRALEKRGHRVASSDWGAVVQAIVVDPEDGFPVGSSEKGLAQKERRLYAVSDPRKDGAPAGV